MTTLKWTIERPFARGWYWFRSYSREGTILMRVLGGGLYADAEDPGKKTLDPGDGEWAGPIEPPEG